MIDRAKIQQLHFSHLPSTQDFLKDYIQKDKGPSYPVLVSAQNQTKGIGQRQKGWENVGHTLAQSFTLPPCEVHTLSSLEMACILAQYIKSKFNIVPAFKWPNDLYLNGKKISGILINGLNNNLLIIGIGLNLYGEHKNFGFLFKEQPSKFRQTTKKEMAYEIYQFIIENRKNPVEIKNFWTANCVHLNQKVIMTEGNDTVEGIFRGIGQYGQAIVELNEGGLKEFISASLTIKE